MMAKLKHQVNLKTSQLEQDRHTLGDELMTLSKVREDLDEKREEIKVVKQALVHTKKSKNKKSTTQKPKAFMVTQRSIEKYLGVKRYRYGVAKTDHQIGQVNGFDSPTRFGSRLRSIGRPQLEPGPGSARWAQGRKPTRKGTLWSEGG